MSAKVAILIAAALFASGCARLGLARFAPPGTVKYEDLAKGRPVDPAIKRRIAERKAERAAAYPDLSLQPSQSPVGISEDERKKSIAELQALRDQIDADIVAARAAAAEERALAEPN